MQTNTFIPNRTLVKISLKDKKCHGQLPCTGRRCGPEGLALRLILHAHELLWAKEIIRLPVTIQGNLRAAHHFEWFSKS